MSYPLRSILHKLDLAGRMGPWATELGQFDIEYIPRTAMKSQLLADFVAEFAVGIEEQNEDEKMEEEKADAYRIMEEMADEERRKDAKMEDHCHQWVLYVDGSSNARGSGAGILLKSPDGDLVEQSLRFGFRASNNEAEYEALIAGLGLALKFGAESIQIFSDSQLVVNKVNGSYVAKDFNMTSYLGKTKEILMGFQKYELTQLPRDQNSHADALANVASAVSSEVKRTIPVGFLSKRSIALRESVLVVEEEKECWTKDILSYIIDSVQPPNKSEA